MFHSWWQKAKKPLEVFCIVVGCMLVIALLVVIALTYIFNVNVAGLHGKTLWDWLQLLFVPALIAFGVVLLTARQNHDREIAHEQHENDNKIAVDNQREGALQAYIGKMSELLLKEHLRESLPKDEVRTIATVQTLTVLPNLDANRKRSVVKFLQESGLITKGIGVISMDEADLHGADLSEANLIEANLRGANLRGANLRKAHLIEADLEGANLSETNLKRAHLTKALLNKASLVRANLFGADLEGTHLNEANLFGAYLPKFRPN